MIVQTVRILNLERDHTNRSFYTFTPHNGSSEIRHRNPKTGSTRGCTNEQTLVVKVLHFDIFQHSSEVRRWLDFEQQSKRIELWDIATCHFRAIEHSDTWNLWVYQCFHTVQSHNHRNTHAHTQPHTKLQDQKSNHNIECAGAWRISEASTELPIKQNHNQLARPKVVCVWISLIQYVMRESVKTHHLHEP